METIPILLWGAWAFRCNKKAKEHETIPCDDCEFLGLLSGKYIDADAQAKVKKRLLEYYPDTTIIGYGKGETMITEDV